MLADPANVLLDSNMAHAWRLNKLSAKTAAATDVRVCMGFSFVQVQWLMV
jgi:hypothetical protein